MKRPWVTRGKLINVMLFISILFSVLLFLVANIQKRRADAQTKLAAEQKAESDRQLGMMADYRNQMQRLEAELNACRGQ
jgi:hypothetical protein